MIRGLRSPLADYNIYGEKLKKRKPFKTSTKKRVWMKAGGHNPNNWRTGFIKTSKCMNPRCRRRLVWGDRSYEFDHFDNNSANNSERNCYLVCDICHRKATRIAKKRELSLLGGTIGYKTIKRKAGYKKLIRRKTHKRKKRRRRSQHLLEIQPIRFPKFKF